MIYELKTEKILILNAVKSTFDKTITLTTIDIFTIKYNEKGRLVHKTNVYSVKDYLLHSYVKGGLIYNFIIHVSALVVFVTCVQRKEITFLSIISVKAYLKDKQHMHYYLSISNYTVHINVLC